MVTDRFRRELVELCALLSLLAAPLLFARAGKPFVHPKEFALALLVAVAFPLAVAGGIRVAPPLLAALALFAAAPLFPGVPPSTDAWDLIQPAWKAMLFLVFAAAFASPRARALAFRVLAVATLLASLLSLAQYYGVDWPDWRIRQGFTRTTLRAAFSTFGNPNFLGEFLALALAPLSVCAVRPGPFRALYAAAAAAGFVALLVTMSRAAWGCFALALVLSALTLGASRAPLLPSRRAASAAFLFALLALAVFSTDNPLNRGAPMISGVDTVADRLLTPTGSVSKRLLAWNVAAHGLSAGGGGRGAGAFGREFLDLQAEFLATPRGAPFVPWADNFDHAHNDWLEDLYDLGVAGAAAAWLFPVLLAGFSLALARRGGEPLHAACAGSVAAWLLLRTIAFPERIVSSFVPWLALAALAVVPPVPPVAPPAPGRRARWLALAALLPALYPLHLAAGRLAADRAVLAGLTAMAEDDTPRAVALARASFAIRPTADALVLEGAAFARSGDFARAAAAYESSLARTADPVATHNLALCRLALGDPQAARPALERTLELFPGHFEAMVPLGRILTLSGFTGPGVAALRRAARWREMVFANPALHDDALFALEKEAEAAWLEALLARGIVAGPQPVSPGRVRLVVPRLNARSVRVIGAFNGYDPERHPLHEREPALFEIELSGLAAGPHPYLLLVDGRKETDPAAERVRFADGSDEVSILRVP